MIIGFAGRKRAGKGVLANMLKRERGYHIVIVANALKELSCELLGMSMEELLRKKDDGTTFDIPVTERHIGIVTDAVSYIDNAEKFVRKTMTGRSFTSVRQVLQFVGTDVIRELDSMWHTKKVVEKIKSFGPDANVVVDDVRFTDERNAIEELGGKVYYIVRPTFFGISNHPSETGLSFHDFAQQSVILNDAGIEGLEDKAKRILFKEEYDTYIWPEAYAFDPKYNLSFGLYMTPIVEQVLKQNIGRDAFMTDGILMFKPNDVKEAERFISEVYNVRPGVDIPSAYAKRFVIDNPLLVENLKRQVVGGTDTIDRYKNFR